VAALTPGLGILGGHFLYVGGGLHLRPDASAPGGVNVTLLSDLWSSPTVSFSPSAFVRSTSSFAFTATNAMPKSVLDIAVPSGEAAFSMREEGTGIK
jgi:hypothetical protein